jgi:hypothetical protein
VIRPTDTVIAGDRYEFMPMAAEEARNNLATIIKTLGPSWAEALDGLKGASIDASVIDDDTGSEQAIMKVIGPIAGSLSGLIRGFVGAFDARTYSALVDSFLKRASVETETGGKMPLVSQNRETLFATKLLTEARVFGWCLSVQYSDFFEYLGQAKIYVEMMTARMASRFASPEQSTGGSSESRGPNDTPVG